jgi:nucleoside-diphosphate-sugar epimerase
MLQAGHDVVALVRSPERSQRLHGLSGSLQLLPGELSHLNGLESNLGRWRPDVCIHLAWYAEPGKYLDSLENLDSLRGSVDLLALLNRIGCRHVLITGSCAEYQGTAAVNHEASPTRARNLYAATKLSLNQIAEQLAEQAGFGLAWARLFNLYGPGEDGRRMVPSLIQTLLRGDHFEATTGDQVRDYLHVDDVATALVGLTERGLSGVFNVCSGTPVTVRRLMQVTGEIIGRADLIQFGALPTPPSEPRSMLGDNQRLAAALGWSPRYSLRDGLENTVEWWKHARAIPDAVGVESK